jgi:hypothetical protein
MPAPGSLYGEGAAMLEAAGGQASNIAKQKQAATDTSVQAGEAASREVGEKDRQMSAQDAQMRLKQMELQENQIKITPQLALGLVKNTGDKSWMETVGQPMRSDVLLSLYTHGINTRIAGKEYKTISDGKEYVIANDIDDNGEIKPRIISVGDAPVNKTGADTEKAKADRASREAIAKHKSATAGTTKENPEDREFIKTYRASEKDTEGINYMMLDQLAKKDPKQEKDLRTKLDFVTKNKDRFNKLQGIKSEDGSGSTDDSKIIEYLKSIGAKDTPKNREWAKTKVTNG